MPVASKAAKTTPWGMIWLLSFFAAVAAIYVRSEFPHFQGPDQEHVVFQMTVPPGDVEWFDPGKAHVNLSKLINPELSIDGVLKRFASSGRKLIVEHGVMKYPDSDAVRFAQINLFLLEDDRITHSRYRINHLSVKAVFEKQNGEIRLINSVSDSKGEALDSLSYVGTFLATLGLAMLLLYFLLRQPKQAL